MRKGIFLNLIHAPRATFNDLWGNAGESNLFAYHLKKMEEEGLVGKFEDGYGLTTEGRKVSAFIEGATGQKAELPTPTVIIMARDETKQKVLCQERLKEPFYGYWGFPSGKVNFGWNPIECAIRDLEEETGLVTGNATLKAVEFIKTYDDGKLLHHHIIFIVEALHCTGILKTQTHKARHEWLTLEEYSQKKRFPDTLPYEQLFKEQTLTLFEVERFMTKGAFTSAKIINTQTFNAVTS